MDKLIGGVLGSVSRIAHVVVKEVLKGGLFVYKGVSGLCASASSGINNLFEEAKGEIRGREAHHQQVPKEGRKGVPTNTGN